MINRLIDMNINLQDTNKNKILHGGDYTTEEYVVAFIEGMSTTQKQRFKKMLENNIESGMSVAKNYGLDYKEFIKEVKKQLKVEV